METLADVPTRRLVVRVGDAAVEPEVSAPSLGAPHPNPTAGGVTLSEVDPGTMQSRVCPGLFLVGEILDVDGRIGGFNFQWAWATGVVGGGAAARAAGG